VSTLASDWLGPLTGTANTWPSRTEVAVSSFPVIPAECQSGTYVIALRLGIWNGRMLQLMSKDRRRPGDDPYLVDFGTIQILDQH